MREKGREVASTTEDSKMGECGWREREKRERRRARERERERERARERQLKSEDVARYREAVSKVGSVAEERKRE